MKPLKILFVTPYLATPPRFGAQRRLDGLMRGLARSHEVAVISFVDPTEDVARSIQATETYCKTVVVVPNDRYAFTTKRKRLLQMRSLLSRRSYESFLYRSPALTEGLEKLLGQVSYDIVNFEFMQMVINRPVDPSPSRSRPIFVLDEHNIEYDIIRRTAASGPGLDRKLYSLLDWRKLRREEREAWRRFDGCTTTSARDDELLRRDLPTARTAIVPNAVDVDFFRPRHSRVEEPMSLLFFGAISYHPNKDGLLFFIREIFPRLKARYPAISLRIVGPSVPPEISAYAGDAIEVTGLVDDIRPFLERATLVIVPLRIGGGTRFKILEAMAMEKAVVSTTVGAEGIDARDESEILLGDTPDAFAGQVGRLLEDQELRRRMGRAARSLIERCYSWERSVARLEQFYAELFERDGASG